MEYLIIRTENELHKKVSVPSNYTWLVTTRKGALLVMRRFQASSLYGEQWGQRCLENIASGLAHSPTDAGTLLECLELVFRKDQGILIGCREPADAMLLLAFLNKEESWISDILTDPQSTRLTEGLDSLEAIRKELK